jgi:hypothetical protein
MRYSLRLKQLESSSAISQVSVLPKAPQHPDGRANSTAVALVLLPGLSGLPLGRADCAFPGQFVFSTATVRTAAISHRPVAAYKCRPSSGRPNLAVAMARAVRA